MRLTFQTMVNPKTKQDVDELISKLDTLATVTQNIYITIIYMPTKAVQATRYSTNGTWKESFKGYLYDNIPNVVLIINFEL